MTMLNKKELAATAMDEAMAWLDARGVHYQHLPPHQLKIDAVNFWPARGTLTVDGEDKRRTAKGLSGLEATLISEGLMRDRSKQVAGPVVRIPLKP